MQYVFPHIRCWSKDLFTTVVLCGLWVYLFSCECITPTRLCPAAPAFPFQLLLQLGYYLRWQIRCGTKLFHTYIDKIHVCWKTSVKGSNNEWGPPCPPQCTPLFFLYIFLTLLIWRFNNLDTSSSVFPLAIWINFHDMIVWSFQCVEDGWMEAVLLQAAGSSSRAGQGGSSSSRPAAAERHRKIQQGGGHTAQTRRRDKRGEDERATPSRTVCDIERGGKYCVFMCL